MIPWASMYNERNGKNIKMCSGDSVVVPFSITKNDAWANPILESTPQNTPNPGISTGALLIISCNQISSMPLAGASGMTKSGLGSQNAAIKYAAVQPSHISGMIILGFVMSMTSLRFRQ